MSSTIGDRMADFHWVTDDGEGTTAKADAADPIDDVPAPAAPDAGQPPEAAAGDDDTTPDDGEIDWDVVKREVAIMLKLNPQNRPPAAADDQASEDEPET